jgi:hypothetical protein
MGRRKAVNAVVVLHHSTVIFTDDQGNVLDRYAVRRISIIDKNTRDQLVMDGEAAGDTANNNEGGSEDEQSIRFALQTRRA